MEELLIKFATYDEKTKSVLLDIIIKKHEKFFVALQYADIPEQINTSALYGPDEIVRQIEEQPHNITNLLKECNSSSFLQNLKQLAITKHPIVSKYRFVKSRDLNDVRDISDFSVFLYPKCRLWLFFKYQILWYMVKNNNTDKTDKKVKIRDFFHNELSGLLTQNLNVLEVCYETKRADDVTGYHVLDVYDFNGESLATKSFEFRYNFLLNLKLFNILPRVDTLVTNEKYLLKRNTDNVYNRTESTLILSRLKMDKYYLLVGETYLNNQTKVYVAKLDEITDKFNIIGCTTKNKTLFPNKLEFTDKGMFFGSEYVWKCAPAPNINYYKTPLTAKVLIMSNKLNMRSSIKEILETPILDRTLYKKF